VSKIDREEAEVFLINLRLFLTVKEREEMKKNKSLHCSRVLRLKKAP
jgi:hypothetical protein